MVRTAAFVAVALAVVHNVDARAIVPRSASPASAPSGSPPSLSSAPSGSPLPVSPGGPQLPPGGNQTLPPGGNSSQSQGWTLQVNSPSPMLLELVTQQSQGNNSTGGPGQEKGVLLHYSKANGTAGASTTVPWIALISCDTDPLASNSSYGDGSSNDIVSQAASEGAVAALVWSLTNDNCDTDATYAPNADIPIYTFGSPEGVDEVQATYIDSPNALYSYDADTLNNNADAIQQQLNSTSPGPPNPNNSSSTGPPTPGGNGGGPKPSGSPMVSQAHGTGSSSHHASSSHQSGGSSMRKRDHTASSSSHCAAPTAPSSQPSARRARRQASSGSGNGGSGNGTVFIIGAVMPGNPPAMGNETLSGPLGPPSASAGLC